MQSHCGMSSVAGEVAHFPGVAQVPVRYVNLGRVILTDCHELVLGAVDRLWRPCLGGGE